MRGKAGDLERLFHIVKYCRKLRIVKDTVQTYEQFNIGQIGELAGGLSGEMKATLADIPWRQIKDMRNQLIHNYGKRRKETIWQVVTEDAQILAERCLEVLRAENSNVDAELREELAEETGIIDEEAH